GKSPNVPKMMAFEAEGAAAIVFDRVIEKPETVATAIRIGNPASWKSAIAARDESRGVIDYVTDPQILSAYSRLAAEEGVFGEPASAASVAGLIKSVENGLDLKGKRIVCIITGNGLKDPDNALKQSAPLTEVPADLDAVERIMTSK
ncbi:MAG: pyridoxal-phosphate dependent enzyme, partial [Proteobacteria bacterium]|nr:pyridoxal-phosphate dependent enzyme [Pseudomonadota bacterium]